MTNPGRYRRRVDLQRAAETRDAIGGITTAYSTYARPWADIWPLVGKEDLMAQQAQATMTHRVRMRYRSGVLPTDRILFGTRVLEINSVRDIGERRRELELMCTEAA